MVSSLTRPRPVGTGGLPVEERQPRAAEYPRPAGAGVFPPENRGGLTGSGKQVKMRWWNANRKERGIRCAARGVVDPPAVGWLVSAALSDILDFRKDVERVWITR